MLGGGGEGAALVSRSINDKLTMGKKSAGSARYMGTKNLSKA